MTLPLTGRTVALAETRQLEDLAQLLEAEGATIWRCPMVSILDAPNPQPVRDWLQKLIAGHFQIVILMTGEALRRMLTVAEAASMKDDVIAALRKTCTICRGPKPVRALREIGVEATMTVTPPTTAGVIASLPKEKIQSQTIGLTLYGAPNPELVGYLEGAGAHVATVLPYVYASAADENQVAELIDGLAGGKVDVMVFTSSPQVDRLYEVAVHRNMETLLKSGLARTRIAAVGPVVAEDLRERGARVDICPERGFVMKNLVQQIVRALGANAK